MPLYSYICSKEHEFDRFLKLKDYAEPQVCECGAKCKKVIKPTMINFDMPDWERYESPASGKPITSYKQRKDDMERTGCVDYCPSMKKTQQDNVAREDAKIDKLVDETVEREYEAMPSKKKEQLENEMKYVDLEYTRN